MKKFNSKQQFHEMFSEQNISLSTLGVSHLLNALADDNLSFQQLAEVLEQFPSVAVKIISLANSAWSAPLEPITDLKSACSRLGVNIVKSVSIALAVSAPFNTARCPTFNQGYFWSHTILVAEVVSMILPLVNESLSFSRLAKPLEAGTTKTAALLHNLGLLFLTHHFPEQSDMVLRRKHHEESRCLHEIFKDILGVTPCDGGSVLALELELPQVLICAMTHYGNKNYTGPDWQVVASITLALELVSAFKNNQPFNPLSTHFGGVIKEGRVEDVINDIEVAHKNIEDIAQSITW